ncbi:MAG TPA: lipopolysaccharide biosynthesis protein [Rhizobiales bacterium]|nr:tyrosine kinase [bacterium BMS3Bbin10]HDO51535.1 lipopolysaccharide biosynthesis protein [Hyphomicrobiales bacterium]
MYPTSWSSSSDDIDIAALLRAIGRRKSRIAFFAIAAAVATYIGLTFVTPQYSSEARILIEREENSYKRPIDLQNASGQNAQTDQEAVASQVEVLLSRDLSAGAVKALNLEEDPEFNKDAGGSAPWRKLLQFSGLGRRPTEAMLKERVLDAFLDRLNVFQLQKSRVIAISFWSRNPEMAAKAANTLADFYLTWHQNEKIKQTKEATAWLSAQISQLTKTVEAADLKVERFRSTSGLLEGSNKSTLDAQQLSGLNGQLVLAKARQTEAEARAALIKKMLEEKGDVAGAADVLNSRLIQRLLEQRVSIQRELAEVSATLLPSHPRLKQLNSELADLRHQIRREARKVVSSLQNEAQIAGARETSLRESLSAMKRSAAKGNESQIKLRALVQEANANRELLKSYLSRYRDASARSDNASIPAFASIVSRAHVSNSPSFPKKGPISLLAFAAIALLGLAHTVGRELILAQHSGRPGARDAGALPAGSASVNQEAGPGQLEGAPDPLAAQSPGEIARRLKASRAGRIIITPASERTEASAQVLEVSRALANAGGRGIVVDAMADSGHLARTMALPAAPGIHQLLSGDAQFEDVIRRDPDSALHVISGKAGPGSMNGLDAQKLNSMLHALEMTYDQIVVYADPGQARIISNIPSARHPALVVVAGDSVSDDHVIWTADGILSGSHADPDVMVLRQGAKQRWQIPQFTPWKRAAAI